MALLWSRDADGVRYEVRAAGRTRRLYTDGIFHSQYNPARPVTGGVWDLMMLPAFMLPPRAVRRVLLLGLGGGTVVRQLQEYVHPVEIVAVEMNPVHIEIAERFFDVQGEGVSLHEADAVAWAREYAGAPFDLVIDDLFDGENGDPRRAVELDGAWCATLARLVSPAGALAINTLGPAHARSVAEMLAAEFPGALQLRAPMDENAVAALFREPVEARQLRRNLMAVPRLNPKRKSNSLRYECRKIF